MKSIYSLKKKIVLNLVVYCRHAYFFSSRWVRQTITIMYLWVHETIVICTLVPYIVAFPQETISMMHLWVQLSRRPFPWCIYELVRPFPSAHWSVRPLSSCIFPRGEAVRHPLPTIMHFFHEMGWWKYFGLIGNALLYLFSI